MSAAAEAGRYARQLLLPDWGPPAQARLARSTVLVAGAGGLGSPVLMYLAAAGVGRILVADADVVDLSNLNRQIVHEFGARGQPKAFSAARALRRLNPDIEVVPFVTRLDDGNVDRHAADAHLIVDCLDNFDGRFALNRCAWRRRIPLVHAAIWGWEGRLTFLEPGRTACLRCLVPEGPPPGTFPVVGTTPGMIGCLQAAEALRYLTGMAPSLRGTLFLLDAATMTSRRLKIRRDPACPDCGGGRG